MFDKSKIDAIADAVGKLSSRFDTMDGRKDASEVYIVEIKTKGSSDKFENDQYRISASSKSEAETKARQRARNLGRVPGEILSARPE